MILVQHQLFAWLHLHNSYPGLILPGLIAPFGVFFMTTYMRGIPRELDEAAMLDGASRWTIFWKVILPLTSPRSRRSRSSPSSAPGTIIGGR